MPRARRRIVQSQRRPTSWLGGRSDAYSTVAANTTAPVVLVSESLFQTFPEPTIVRIRGIFSVYLTSSAATTSSVTFTAGLALLTSRALLAANVPRPGTEIDYDGWMWWTAGHFTNHNVTVDYGSPHVAQRIEIDSKAMRKVSNDEALVCVVQTENSVGSESIKVALSARVLVKR